MQHYSSQAFTDLTKPAGGATIAIKLAGTNTNATIYSDDGVTIKSNPFSADSLGHFDFYAASGKYDITITGTQLTTYTMSNQVLFDPFEQTAADTGIVVKNLTANAITGPVAGNLAGNVTGNLISPTANPAATGIVRLANTDAIKFRNAANSTDITALSDLGTASGNLPADVISVGGGGLQAPAFISPTINPSGSGIVRLASTDAIKFRNNANSADINGLSKNASDAVILGDPGVSSAGVVLNGTVKQYNNISLVANGISTIVAQNNSNQTGTFGPVSLYFVPLINSYRLTYYVYTALTGNTVTANLSIGWLDQTGTSQSVTQPGTVAVQTLGSFIAGSQSISSNSGAFITFSGTFSGSAGLGTVNYILRLELLG